MNNIQNLTLGNWASYGIDWLYNQANQYAKNYWFFYIKEIICNKYTSWTFGNEPDVWKIQKNNWYYNYSYYSKWKYDDNWIIINEPITTSIIVDTSTMKNTWTTYCTIEYSRWPFLDFYYNYWLEILFFIIVCISFIIWFIKWKLNF